MAPTAAKAGKKPAPKRASKTPRRTHNDQKQRPQIALRLRQLMAEAGLSQEQLEREAGVDQYTISRLSNGHNTARPGNVKLLADTFTRLLGRQIDPNYLMGGGGVRALGEYLQHERRRRSLTLAGFAAVLGLEPHRIGHLEGGESWGASEMGRVLLAMPAAYPLVLDALLEIGGAMAPPVYGEIVAPAPDVAPASPLPDAPAFGINTSVPANGPYVTDGASAPSWVRSGRHG